MIRQKTSDQRTGGGLHHRDFISIPLIRQLKFCALLCYASWWHCYILAVPRKVTNSLLVLRKETCKTEWLTITVFFFFLDKKIGLCVWLDKTFNWEETLLIAFSEVKCPLNKTIYWLNHIISTVINLNHLMLMKFTGFSIIHFSLWYQIRFMHMYIHKKLYISMH